MHRAPGIVRLDVWASPVTVPRDGTRGGSDLMEKAALDLTDADIAALADWFSGLAPEKR